MESAPQEIIFSVLDVSKSGRDLPPLHPLAEESICIKRQ